MPKRTLDQSNSKADGKSKSEAGKKAGNAKLTGNSKVTTRAAVASGVRFDTPPPSAESASKESRFVCYKQRGDDIIISATPDRSKDIQSQPFPYRPPLDSLPRPSRNIIIDGKIPDMFLIPVQPAVGESDPIACIVRRAQTAREQIKPLPADTLSPAPYRALEILYETATRPPQAKDGAAAADEEPTFKTAELRGIRVNHVLDRSGDFVKFQYEYVYLSLKDRQVKKVGKLEEYKFGVRGVVTVYDWQHSKAGYDVDVKSSDWPAGFFPRGGYLAKCSLSRCCSGGLALCFPMLSYLSSYIQGHPSETSVTHFCGYSMHFMCAFHFFFGSMMNSALWKEEPYFEMYTPDFSISAMDVCGGCGQHWDEEDAKLLKSVFLTYYCGLGILPDASITTEIDMRERVRSEFRDLKSECPTVLTDMRDNFMDLAQFRTVFRNTNQDIVRRLVSPPVLKDIAWKCNTAGKVTPADLLRYTVDAFKKVNHYSIFGEIFRALRGDFETVTNEHEIAKQRYKRHERDRQEL